uniref:Uncharacterized protein n=1 Tax=Arundo donax TaxID=35708 RepID=A0A0A8Z500_ARUDO
MALRFLFRAAGVSLCISLTLTGEMYSNNSLSIL